MDRKATLLLVDDEIRIIQALQRVFHQQGYAVLSATDPLAALEIMRQNPIDLIVCDQQMPNMSGVELLRESRQILPDAVRILLTGHTDFQMAVAAINEGSIYHFFTKPWSNSELITVIESALDKKRQEAEQKNLYHSVSEKLDSLSNLLKAQILPAPEAHPAAANASGSAVQKPAEPALQKLSEHPVYKLSGPANVRKPELSAPKTTESAIQKISVWEDEEIILIDPRDILYFAATEGDVTVVTRQGPYKSREPISHWTEKLEANGFFRAHRGYLVNLGQIEKISPWFNGAYNIKLKGLPEPIPVSRNSTKKLKELLGL